MVAEDHIPEGAAFFDEEFMQRDPEPQIDRRGQSIALNLQCQECNKKFKFNPRKAWNSCPRCGSDDVEVV